MSSESLKPKVRSIHQFRDEVKTESPEVHMRYLVKALIKYNASDLHLRPSRPPLYRISGNLVAAKMPELRNEQIEAILGEVMNDRLREKLEQDLYVDFSFGVPDMGRFRCNIYYQRGNLSAAIRMIPSVIPRAEALGIPPVLAELAHRQRGLILVTGSTGSGKSTTLASLIQQLNENSAQHIITIEDPIEYMHRDLKCMITQREVGTDTHSMRDALTAALRQDPDVIIIGEMRDPETIQLALTAAETGHLVLSTLHTNDARGTLSRILDIFAPDARDAIRTQLSSTLLGISSQHLIPRLDGKGRVLACEVMVKSPAIESYIFHGEFDKIPDAISSSSNYYKMQSLNQVLEKMVLAKQISEEEALRTTSNPEDLRLRLSGLVKEEGYQPASR